MTPASTSGTLCLWRKILFSKSEFSGDPFLLHKNAAPVVSMRTFTLGKVTFIHFHVKEPPSLASPLHWDPPEALPATLPILSAPLAL